jgi:hypothetical protein
MLKSVVLPGETAARWRLVWSISESGLSGPITQAAIRVGRKGETGPVLVALCAPCRPTNAGGVPRTLTSAQATALRTSPLYVTVATAANPSGEIRGQITRSLPSRLAAPTSTNKP